MTRSSCICPSECGCFPSATSQREYRDSVQHVMLRTCGTGSTATLRPAHTGCQARGFNSCRPCAMGSPAADTAGTKRCKHQPAGNRQACIAEPVPCRQVAMPYRPWIFSAHAAV